MLKIIWRFTFMAIYKKFIDLTVDSLKEESSQMTHLFDWGNNEFELPLEQFINCFKEKYALEDELFYTQFFNAIKAILFNRLYIQNSINSYPDILKSPICRPLFIVGIARTGSTFFHRLINQDPSCRTLKYWEMRYPFFGTNIGLNHEKFSMELAELNIKEVYSKLPNLFHIHEIKAKAPEECNIIMRHTFCSLYLASEWALPKYAQWLLNHNMAKSYEYYKKMLQILQWYKPGEYLALKCPSHILNLEIILKIFPDANILWLHRHPFKSIPSYLNLLSVFWGNEMNEKFIDFICNYSKKSIDKGMEMKKKVNSAQFYNLSYREFINAPYSTILKVLNHFKYKIDTRLESNIHKWIEENPRNKHGVHNYNLEKFGLEEMDIQELFSPYLEEYRDFLN